MDEKTPSARSRTRSSAAASKAGSAPAKPAGKAAAPARARTGARSAPRAEPLAVLDRAARGDFPAIVYLEGADEAVKAAFLSEYRRLWAAAVPEAPLARVLRPDEQDVDAILAAYQNVSLFAPRELTVVFQMEKLARSEKKVGALAVGLASPAGASSLVLVEAATDNVRKTLEPVRAAASVRVEAEPPDAPTLLEWARRRLAAAGVEAEPGVLEALLETCELDAIALFNETGKLAVLGRDGRVTLEHVRALTAPRLGADIPGYLLAVAQGDAGLAAQRLERVLAAGESEGSVLWSLGNLVGGALGGWTRVDTKPIAALLARRRRPRELARALDAVYRAEAAWKGGRADVFSALEQATREVAAS